MAIWNGQQLASGASLLAAAPAAPITLTDGADHYAAPAAGSVMGLRGNDTLTGAAGADELFGNQGTDLLVGGDGADTAYGGQDNDSIYGEEGDDLLQGNQGDDVLYGDAGNDTLNGSAGADTLSGGVGDDTLYVGDGETVWWQTGDGTDLLDSRNGTIDTYTLVIDAGAGQHTWETKPDGSIWINGRKVAQCEGDAGDRIHILNPPGTGNLDWWATIG